jgi:uncharacterized membrane protein (UPF0127 family)
MAVPSVIIFAIASAIGLIAAVVIMYHSPAITSMLGQPEGEQQQLSIGQQVRSANHGYRQVNVTVNGLALVAYIASTDEQRVKGLSVKDSLAENEAMLFVFDYESDHTFWMKNMKFPIDIIWIDSDKSVVHIEPNLQPCNSELFCPTYKPIGESLYVLETTGGFAERHDIVKGTMVDFELTA